jgi:outer membrane receptor protein involved in Fe transport
LQLRAFSIFRKIVATMKAIRNLFLALLLALVGTLCGLAQDSIKITVQVVDANGAALKGVPVELAQNRLVSTSPKTDASGSVSFDLTPGEYELMTGPTGFETAVQRLTVSANDQPRTVVIRLTPVALNETLTVTPARTSLRLEEAPANVSLLNAQDVQLAAAQTVDDLLRQVPGFSIFRRSSSLVANPTTQGVSLRGAGASGASRTLVLQDGVPLNDAFGGWVYWDRVARAAIQQVEIVRGGASDLYGSDALSGVINVLARRTDERHVFAEASYGQRATRDATFFASDAFGKLSAAVSGQTFATDGYFLVAPERRGTADAPAASQHRNLGVRLQYALGQAPLVKEGYAFARGSLFDEDRRNGTQVQRNDTATEGLATGVRFKTNDGSEWQLTLFAHQQRYHQNFTAVAANRNSETLNRLQFVPARDAGLSFSWSHALAHKHLLVAGADVRGVRGTSDETAIANNRATTFVSSGGRQRRAGFFLQDIWQATDKLSIMLSGRYDTWRDSSGASVSRNLTTNAVTPVFYRARSTDAFNPRLALSYELNARVALKAAGYRAFRAPTLNELYRSFRVGDTLTNSNAALIAERLTGGEAGASFELARNWNARLTGFFTETVNPIANFTLSATPTLITRERRNLGRTRSTGLEAESDLRLKTHWQITTGYLYVAATVRRAPQDARLLGLDVPQVPRHQFTLQTSYDNPRWLTAALQFRAVGRQFDDDQNQLLLAGFAVFDINAARRLGRWIEAFIAVQNVFDKRFVVARTPLENFGMPRMVRGGIRFRLER